MGVNQIDEQNKKAPKLKPNEKTKQFQKKEMSWKSNAAQRIHHLANELR